MPLRAPGWVSRKTLACVYVWCESCRHTFEKWTSSGCNSSPVSLFFVGVVVRVRICAPKVLRSINPLDCLVPILRQLLKLFLAEASQTGQGDAAPSVKPQIFWTLERQAPSFVLVGPGENAPPPCWCWSERRRRARQSVGRPQRRHWGWGGVESRRSLRQSGARVELCR